MTRSKLTIYDAANAEAARIILASPERYEGLPLQWALTVAGKTNGGEARPKREPETCTSR